MGNDEGEVHCAGILITNMPHPIVVMSCLPTAVRRDGCLALLDAELDDVAAGQRAQEGVAVTSLTWSSNNFTARIILMSEVILMTLVMSFVAPTVFNRREPALRHQ